MIKRYWKIALALVVIFAAGAGLGYSIGLRNSRSHFTRMRDPGNWQTMMLDRLDHQVTLTDEQRQKIQPLFRKLGEETGKIRMEADRQNRECFGKFYQEVNPILTEEQRKLLEEERRRLRERLKDGPPPGGGPFYRGGPGGPSDGKGPHPGWDRDRDRDKRPPIEKLPLPQPVPQPGVPPAPPKTPEGSVLNGL